MVLSLWSVSLSSAAAATELTSTAGTPTNDTDWIRWVTVAVWPDNDLPAWLLTQDGKQRLFEDMVPDIIDWAHGLAADRAGYFQSRGVAVAADSAEEYDQCFDHRMDNQKIFTNNGIEQQENGELVFDSDWGTFHMEHHAPLWHEVQHGGFARRATLGADGGQPDAVTHDNIGGQYCYHPRWSSWSCRRFVDWCNVNNKSLPAGFDLSSGMRDRVAMLRAASNASAIPVDPVLHEYMRFQMTVGTRKWSELVIEAKRA
eukprot:COSAG02_NODE_9840_length_2095_cov_10.704409_1_plen_257_part_10